ncbi:MAG: magnesium transporter, partial [Paracoccaceae bacterium]
MNQNLSHEDDREDDAYVLDTGTVLAVLAAVDVGDATELTALMEPLHAADIADLLEQIGETERRHLVQLYDREFDGEILSELDEGLREEIIDALHPDVLAEAVRELESDDVVDLLEDLEEPQQAAILDVLEDGDRVAVEQALAFPEYSAGRLMQREVVMAPEHWQVGQAIDHLRASDNLPEEFYHMILVNPRAEPVGQITLGRLLGSRRDVPLSSLLEDSFRTFDVAEDEADVAYAFNQYHLISAPVIDAEQRLVGVITIDDAMGILDEEHEEDLLRLAGVGESSLSDKALDTMKR